MAGEFLVVSGPRLGKRFSLSDGEVCIGRAPNSTIRLEQPGVAWEHCTISLCGERYRLADRRSGTGTYVNGMRTAEHWLAPGDQVAIGDTVFIYSVDSADAAPNTSPQQTLLRACSLLFLFRAVASSENDALRDTFQTQLARLIGDLAPSIGGAVLLGRDVAELHAAAGTPALQAIADRVCREGPVILAESQEVAVPLYVRGSLAGLIAAQFPACEAANLADHCDTLAAVATLGAIALETEREVATLNTEKALLLERLESADHGIVGESPALRKLMQMVSRVAGTDTSVLILG